MVRSVQVGLTTGKTTGSGALSKDAVSGKLSLDATQLGDQLATRFSDVKALLRNVTGKYATEGPFNDQQKAAKAAAAPGSDDWMIQWESHAPKIKPGIAMPVFAQAEGGQLTPDNITDIVAYLKSLK